MTTIPIKDKAMPLRLKTIRGPNKILIVKGTINGARSVSSTIRVKDRAPSPEKIEFQIKPETAVGMAKRRTKPAAIS